MAYLGNQPGVSSQRTVLEEVVSGSPKSSFVPLSGYIRGYVDVLVNGIEIDAADFTADDGVTVNLVTPAAVGDTVKVKAWLPRGLTDGYLKSEADAKFALLGTSYTKTEADAKYALLAASYTKAEDDARFLNLAGGTLTGGLTVTGNLLLAANSGGSRTIGFSGGTNTTLVLQGGGASGSGANLELTRDYLAYMDANTTQFRSVDGASVYGQFNGSGFSVGTNSPQRRVHFYDTGIFPLLVESNHIDAVALEIKHSNTRAWAIAVAGPTSAVGQTPGNFYLYDEAAGTVRFIVDTSGNLKFNSGFGSNGTAYGCRAWINFNGQTTSILGSGNISSLTRVNTGCFDIGMSSAMPDTNYSIGGSVQNGSFGIAMIMGLENYDYGRIKSTTGIRIYTRHDGYIRVDSPDVSVNIFR